MEPSRKLVLPIRQFTSTGVPARTTRSASCITDLMFCAYANARSVSGQSIPHAAPAASRLLGVDEEALAAQRLRGSVVVGEGLCVARSVSAALLVCR
jgi:hypothetical protein